MGRGEALVAPGAYPMSYRLDVVLDEIVPIGDERASARASRDGATSRRGSSASAIASPSCGSTVPSSRPAAIASSCARETTLGGGTVLDPAPPATATPRVSSCSPRVTSRRRSTRPCGWRRCATCFRRSSSGVERAGPWVFSAELARGAREGSSRAHRVGRPDRSRRAGPGATLGGRRAPASAARAARLQALSPGLHADPRAAEPRRPKPWLRSSAWPGCERRRSTTRSSLGSSRRVGGSYDSARATSSARTRSRSRGTSFSSSVRPRAGSRWRASGISPAPGAATRSCCSSGSMRTGVTRRVGERRVLRRDAARAH